MLTRSSVDHNRLLLSFQDLGTLFNFLVLLIAYCRSIYCRILIRILFTKQRVRDF